MRRWSDRIRGSGLLLTLAACGGGSPPAAAVDSGPARTDAPRDSLVLRLPDSVEVWLSEGRTGRDGSGTTCFERTVKIRSPTGTRTVPLLYTGRAPAVLDRGALRAELWKDCRPMADYRVDLATGRPTKLADR